MTSISPTPHGRRCESNMSGHSPVPKTPPPPLFTEKIKSAIPHTIRRSLLLPSFQKSLVATEDPHIRFDKIIELLTGKYTSIVYERHAAVLDKLAKIYHQGVVLNDAKELAVVLELVFERIHQGGSVILPSLTKLVRCFGTSIELKQIEIREKDSIQKKTTSFLDALSNLVTLNEEEMTEYACNAIYMLTGGPSNTEDNGHLYRVNLANFSLNETVPLPDVTSPSKPDETHEQSRELLFGAGENSDSIIQNLTEALRNTSNLHSVLSIFKCLRWLSKSDVVCKKMIGSLTFETVQNLMRTQPQEVKFFGVEILWNGLESVHGAHVAEILSSHEGLSTLKLLFDDVTIHGQRQHELQLRNEIMILFIRIANLAPHKLGMFKDTDVIDSITLFLTHKELQLDHPAVQGWKLTNSFYDFEFKRLLIHLSSILTSNSSNLEVFLEDGILQFMMIYLGRKNDNPGVQIWRPTQLRTLQIQIISLLNQLVPKVSKDFRVQEGYLTLCKFLRHIIQEGKQPEMSRVDIARDHINLLKGTLSFILTLTELGPTSKKMLASSGIFENLISLLIDENQPSMIWTMCLVTCSSLCQGYKANKIAFGDSNGVDAVIKFLKFNSADPQEREMLLLTTVECIWGAVCGNVINEDSFFTHGGVFLLLDLLEMASANMKRHILGCILDLCENPKPIYHLLQWRTKKNIDRGIEHLLIDIWNEEEVVLGVQNAKDESIIVQKDISPLLGKNQKVIDLCRDGCEPDGGRAVHEISENLRAKVYSMFCKLGFERFSDSLTTQEKVKLTLISKYLDFKIGEVWAEISAELAFEGIRPISPDLDSVNTVRDVMNKKVEAVQQKQAEQIRKATDVKKQEESHFYDHFLETAHVHDPKHAQHLRHTLHSWKLPNH